MKLRSLIVGASLALASGAVWAHGCPKEMKAIDAALPAAKVSPAQMADVQKYRSEGEALHKAGKHQESMDTLARAKKILGI